MTRPLSCDDLAVLTVSYRGDLRVAAELCHSLDRYLAEGAEHVLVVPRSDVALFEPLLRPGRRLVTVESVLPPGYVRLPLPHSVGLGRRRRRVRELWLGPGGRPVRGWIVQQVVKLCAPDLTDREVVVLADSDIVLVAPFGVERVVRDDTVRLYRVPGACAELATHVRWHDVSARLLGLAPHGYTGADYIGNLITWRRSTVVALQDRLAQVAGVRWDVAVARERDLSEYVLYGVFADLVLDAVDAGHHREQQDLVHAGWFYDLHTAEGLEEFVGGLTGAHVGVAIQSTEPFTLEERRALVDRMCQLEGARAARAAGAHRADLRG